MSSLGARFPGPVTIALSTVGLVVILGCGGLFDPTPSSEGTCSGSMGGVSVDGALDPSGSYFARDDRHHGVEYAFVGLAVQGEGRFRLIVDGHLRDMPSDDHVGRHPLVGRAGFVDRWQVTTPEDVTLEAGELHLTAASRQRLDGTLWMVTDAGDRVECTFALGRDMNRDTDD